MKLSELAFACFLYGRFTDYNSSYLNFLKATNHSPDLSKSEHRKILLVWLNKWGCRQFAIEFHDLASAEILSWHNDFASILFTPEKNIWDLTEVELEQATEAYDALSSQTASFRNRDGEKYPVSVGPTGASKILFAIRRNAFIPWDEPIREKFGYDGSGKSYLNYLKYIKSILKSLKPACEKNGFDFADLPKQLGRPDSTVPKLIDEFYWVTITNNCSSPSTDNFLRWARWSKEE